MMKCIYINNDKIQIVHSKGSNYSCSSYDLEEGSIVNGVITNQDEIVRVLQGCGVREKVSLMIDSSHIMVKKLQVPKLSRDKIMGGIRSEFEFDEGVEVLVDYTVLQTFPNEYEILASAVDKQFIDKYIEVCKLAKIKIDNISITINSIVKHVLQAPTLQEKTFILNIVIGNMIVAILFENGQYRLVSRNRMLSESSDDGYCGELYSKLSAMIQFSKSQKSDYEITESYYIGLSEEILSEYIKFMDLVAKHIEIKRYQIDGLEMNYFYPALGVNPTKNDLNLYRVATTKKKNSSSSSKNILALMVPVVLCAIIGISYITMAISNDRYCKENKVLEKEIAVLQDQISEDLGHKDAQNNKLTAIINQFTVVLEEVEKTKLVQPELVHKLQDNSYVTSITYNISSASLSFSGEVPKASDATEFAASLREEEYSDSLEYKGYGLLSGQDKYAFDLISGWTHPDSQPGGFITGGTTND